MGIILPIMGTKLHPSLADALFTPVQQRVLGLVYGQPDRSFQSGELIRLAHSGTGAVVRQLARLAASGWITVSAVGNQKYYQANKECPAFHELHGLVLKTVGLVEPIRMALSAIASKIELAFVYGSVARGETRARSDVDLMVISDRVTYPDVFDAVQQAEHALSRVIHPTVMTRREWNAQRKVRGSFAAKIIASPRIFLVGSDDQLS
jgi:predicted nucleotidyltransferase